MIASKEHWKSATVIGEPSSQTALGLMLIVSVIPAPEPPAVVSAPPAVVAGADVADAPVVSVAPAAVVPGAAVVLLDLLSLPHAAATKARPTANAANRVLRFVVLTWVFLLCETEGGRARSIDKASGRLVGKIDHTLAPSSPIGASADTISPLYTREQQRHSDCFKNRAENSGEFGVL